MFGADPCNPGDGPYCQNGGACTTSGGVTTCNCAGLDFTGDRCEIGNVKIFTPPFLECENERMQSGVLDVKATIVR